ncbi:hypothetical protein HDU82_008430 [Entophlyctis luteolus]|nr:hypothetical protein HDU82_008430 [Entophlyctis luteolus]
MPPRDDYDYDYDSVRIFVGVFFAVLILVSFAVGVYLRLKRAAADAERDLAVAESENATQPDKMNKSQALRRLLKGLRTVGILGSAPKRKPRPMAVVGMTGVADISGFDSARNEAGRNSEDTLYLPA